jgi:hypothetical protein
VKPFNPKIIVVLLLIIVLILIVSVLLISFYRPSENKSVTLTGTVSYNVAFGWSVTSPSIQTEPSSFFDFLSFPFFDNPLTTDTIIMETTLTGNECYEKTSKLGDFWLTWETKAYDQTIKNVVPGQYVGNIVVYEVEYDGIIFKEIVSKQKVTEVDFEVNV